jgi:hypothetical protein
MRSRIVRDQVLNPMTLRQTELFEVATVPRNSFKMWREFPAQLLQRNLAACRNSDTLKQSLKAALTVILIVKLIREEGRLLRNVFFP